MRGLIAESKSGSAPTMARVDLVELSAGDNEEG